MEFKLSERKILRELASEVYEAEPRHVLADLAACFVGWRRKKRVGSDLSAYIHSFQD